MITEPKQGDAEEQAPPPADPPAVKFVQMRHTRSRSGIKRTGGGASYPYIGVRENGEVLIVNPDDATIRAWNEEHWTIVTVAFAEDWSELALTKATNDFGVGIRRYPKLRTCVHITIKGLGRAKPRDVIGACAVRREGDSFFFGLGEQVVIEPTGSNFHEQS